MPKRSQIPRIEGPNQLCDGRLGYRFLYNANDIYIGASLEAYGEFSGVEADLIEALVAPGDVVIEVGANIGALSVGIAKKLGPRGRLFAFEPQRVVFQMLCANIALNSLFNVECLWMAVGAQRGMVVVPEMNFSKKQNFGGLSIVGAQTGHPVPCETLDGLLDSDSDRDRVRLIKIDVEGMELDVLSGARRLIMKSRPMIYLENDRREKSAALITLLGELNYDLYWHTPPLYRKENHFANPRNIFGRTLSCNMLSLPRERMQTPPPLQKVTGPHDRPRFGPSAPRDDTA